MNSSNATERPMGRRETYPVRDLEDFAGIASDWFWETDADHRFTYFSSRMEEVTHMHANEIIGRRRDQINSLADGDVNFAAHVNDLHNHRPFRNFEYRLKRQMAEGHIWIRVSGDPVFDGRGQFMGYRGTGHDVTPEKEALARVEAANAALVARNQELDTLRRELELAAFEDPLTGLRNRRAFDALLTECLAKTRPQIALMLVDLDRFKAVNDTYGHPAGDMVLLTASERISREVASDGEAFRIGGDEFAIILKQPMNEETAKGLGYRIVGEISKPIGFKDHSLDVAASIGLALCKSIPTRPSRLIAAADKALYKAKQSGRNCVKIAPQ